MLDPESRLEIMQSFGEATDDLVRDLYSTRERGISIVQEPEITSRLCQRLEDRLDNRQAGEYRFRVIAQSMPDRGPSSIERISGADLFMSVSLEGQDGFDKGIFVQAKYDRNINAEELQEACRRMRRISQKNSIYGWIYEPEGVKVLSAHQIDNLRGSNLDAAVPRSMAGFIGRILDCYAGSKKWGIPASGNRRALIAEKLHEIRVNHTLDVLIKRS